MTSSDETVDMSRHAARDAYINSVSAGVKNSNQVFLQVPLRLNL